MIERRWCVAVICDICHKSQTVGWAPTVDEAIRMAEAAGYQRRGTSDYGRHWCPACASEAAYKTAETEVEA